MLAGALLGCVLMALMMANAGGAWDNAKKYIEKGNFGGKGSDVHAAAVVGDTVGDPFKDTFRSLDEHFDQCHGNRKPCDCPSFIILIGRTVTASSAVTVLLTQFPQRSTHLTSTANAAKRP
jgi:hypothetical protein